AALMPSVLTRHPIYLAVSLGLIAVTYQRLARHTPTAAAWGSFARLSMIFVLFTLVANSVLGGIGETTLFELPGWRWYGARGEVLFQLGGPVTLESLVAGLTTAVALLAVIFALATFNSLADHYQLLRSLPSFLYQAATVVSIALTFLPQLVRAQREIREAHALRGHRIHGLRDLLPLVVTLLAEGLDRAMSLAESMEARGFSGPPRDPRAQRRSRLQIAFGLGLMLTGFIARDLRLDDVPGGWLAAAGGLTLTATIWRLGRGVHRSRYRHQLWRWRDTVLTLCSLASLTALSGLYLVDGALFFFQPFPRITWPSFDPRVVVPMLLLLTPIALPGRPRVAREDAGR
ncbi:MAG: energy-coupling factor transporter transmembrane component T, partial [Thermoanaerobaculia bacterium]